MGPILTKETENKSVRTLIEGEIFLHKELWRVVSRQMLYARDNQKASIYDYLVAMIFAFHTLEAYLNFVGERLAPSIWKDERNYFRNEPYRGFDGKVRKILELCNITEPDRTNRPYSTIWYLKDLRDFIAHGRPEKFSDYIDHSPDQETSLFRTPFGNLVTQTKACHAEEDVKAFLDMIHSAAKPLVNDIWFGEDALGGILQYSSGSTTMAPSE
jgi:hypothetical protein